MTQQPPTLPTVDPDSSLPYWSSFYERFPLKAPSSFARFVLERLKGEKLSIADLGCGNLRDTNFFAREGLKVLAVDQVDNSRFIEEEFLDRVKFVQLDISDVQLFHHLHKFSQSSPSKVAAYARFVLHAMSPEVQQRFLHVIFNCLGVSWYLFEFRTTEDGMKHHTFSDHQRHFVDIAEFLNYCRSRGDLEVVYEAKGTGLAPFKDEDPVVGRVILKRRPHKRILPAQTSTSKIDAGADTPEFVFPTGRIDAINENEIKGWAVEAPGKDRAVVTLSIDGEPMMSVRTAGQRDDVAAMGLPATSGFRFPLSPGLRGIVRTGARIRVSVGNVAIPPIEGLTTVAPFGAQHSADVMRSVLAAGFRPSPKHGALFRPISARPDFDRIALESYRRLRKHLQDLEHPDFLVAFGSLLGLRRDGKLIADDDDFDGLIVIEADDVGEFIRRYLAFLTKLKASNCQMEVYHDGLHISIFIPGGVPIDSFVGWYNGKELLAFHTVLPCERGALSGVEMENFSGVYAPACTDRLLEHWYGPTWRTPDPYFQWELADEVKTRFHDFARQVQDALKEFRATS